MDDRGHAGIADQDLGKIACGRIADEGRPQVADQKSAHGRQLGGKAARQLDRFLATESRQQFVADEQRAAMDLIAQGIQRNAQGIADEVVDILAIEVGLAIVPGNSASVRPLRMASRASREGARRASPSRRMLWVSSREMRSSATIRSRCQRTGEGTRGRPSRGVVIAAEPRASSFHPALPQRTCARGILTSASRSRSVSWLISTYWPFQ